MSTRMGRELAPANDGKLTATGRLVGHSGLLWALFVDAVHVNRWDVASEPKAFRMVERRVARPIVDVGGERGIVAQISTSGSTIVWSHPDGLVMCDYFPQGDVDPRKSSGLAKIAPHVLAAPTAGRPRTLGELRITSGVLAISLPYVKPHVTPAIVAKAKAAKKATEIDGLCLVPIQPGRYELVTESLGEYRVSEGLFAGRLWIVKRGTFRKTVVIRSRPSKPAPPQPRKADPYAHRRTAMLAGGGSSVLFVRELEEGKDFVLIVVRGRQLSTESGRWGDEGVWSKKTLPTRKAAIRAFFNQDHRLVRQGYRRTP